MSMGQAISQGEGKTLEFKVELPNSNTLAKTIVAFSNTGGGKLIVGVNNLGELVGLKPEVDVLALQDQVASIIYETCYPNILPDIYTTTIDGKMLLVIEVYRGNLLPYHLKKQGRSEGVYIRVGATNRRASPDNIQELERQRMNIGYDQEVNRDVKFGSLDITPLRERFVNSKRSLDINAMKNLRLIHEENGEFCPTNGLLILLGKYEHVKIRCSRFKGVTMDVFLDSKEYDMDLFTQLEKAEGFIKNHMSLSGEIKGLQRQDQFEIPLEAIRESLVNAIVHRDYTNKGRDIKVGIYDDMINIVSPGSFPSTITQDDILEGRSEIRNKVLARVFKELNYIEQWGSGIRRIKSSCISRGLQEPEIIEKGDFVDVCLYREQHVRQSGTDNALIVRDYEEQIAKHLQSGQNRITTKEAEGLLGLGERRSRKILREMTDKGVLERVGKTTNTYYRLCLRHGD